MDIYTFLKNEMRARGWNMSALAKASGMSKQAIGQWLTEDESARLVPNTASCEKLAAALEIDPDYVLALAGHRKTRADQVNTVSTEMDAHLARYGAVLSRYPRAVWRAVLEANEAMAAAMAQVVPPVSDSKEGGVNAQDDAQTRGDHDSDAGLTAPKRPLRSLQPVGAF